MSKDIKEYIGQTFEDVLIVWLYLNGNPVCIVNFYVKGHSYFRISCSEENVTIREQKEAPQDFTFDEFTNKVIKQDIEWLQKNTVVSIKYLIDSYNIKRGLIIFFENNHNIVFYNEGYDYGDEEIFEKDININSLPYEMVDYS